MAILQAALDYYRSLPNWAQLAIQWLIRAAIASFILAQWSGVATYWYAMRYGARPPVEGVPFLALTVAVLGLALLALTLALFQVLPIVLKIIRTISGQLSNSRNNEIEYNDCNESSVGYWMIIEKIAASLLVFMMFFILLWVAFPGGLQEIISVLTDQDEFFYKMLFFLFIFFVSILALKSNFFGLLHDRNINRISFSLYMLSILAMMISMLGSSFDHILRATKFGGGVKVDIELRDQRPLLTGKSLFLTSANFITIFDPATGDFNELNRDHIVRIKYAGIEGWHLPREKAYAEIFGFDDLSRRETATGAAPEVKLPKGQP